MSAPSKQECSFCRGSGVVHGEQCVACAGRGASTSELNRLAEENKRLREQARAAEWRVSLADENERLRVERAECLALLETAPTGGTSAGSYKAVVEWTEARRALLSKLSRDAAEPCWYCERPSVDRRKESGAGRARPRRCNRHHDEAAMTADKPEAGRTCKPWCGCRIEEAPRTANQWRSLRAILSTFCSSECADALRPLNPAPRPVEHDRWCELKWKQAGCFCSDRSKPRPVERCSCPEATRYKAALMQVSEALLLLQCKEKCRVEGCDMPACYCCRECCLHETKECPPKPATDDIERIARRALALGEETK